MNILNFKFFEAFISIKISKFTFSIKNNFSQYILILLSYFITIYVYEKILSDLDLFNLSDSMRYTRITIISSLLFFLNIILLVSNRNKYNHSLVSKLYEYPLSILDLLFYSVLSEIFRFYYFIVIAVLYLSKFAIDKSLYILFFLIIINLIFREFILNRILKYFGLYWIYFISIALLIFVYLSNFDYFILFFGSFVVLLMFLAGKRAIYYPVLVNFFLIKDNVLKTNILFSFLAKFVVLFFLYINKDNSPIYALMPYSILSLVIFNSLLFTYFYNNTFMSLWKYWIYYYLIKGPRLGSTILYLKAVSIPIMLDFILFLVFRGLIPFLFDYDVIDYVLITVIYLFVGYFSSLSYPLQHRYFFKISMKPTSTISGIFILLPVIAYVYLKLTGLLFFFRVAAGIIVIFLFISYFTKNDLHKNLLNKLNT